MIARIEGIVIEKDAGYLVILVGGIGVELLVTRVAHESAHIDERVSLLTRLIVREDALTLYGFATEQERNLFDTIIKISGVGPKLAITILSTLSADNLRNAVVNERPEIVTRVPGIGKKTAQKILFELKDKIPVGLDTVPGTDEFDDVNSDVMDALVSLGFSVIEAQSAVQSLPADAPDDAQERVRLALQYLSR